MALVVNCPLAIIRDEVGRLRHFYFGDGNTVLPNDLDKAHVAHLVAEGFVKDTTAKPADPGK